MDKNDNFSQESDSLSPIFAAFKETVRQGFQDDLNKQKHRIRVVERHNSSLLVRIDELEQENKRLNEQLTSALQDHSDAQPNQPLASKQDAARNAGGGCPTSAPTTDRTEAASVSLNEWSELKRKYNHLREQHDQRTIAMERLESRCRKYKENAREWEKYAKKNEKLKKPDHQNKDAQGSPTPTSVMSPFPEGEILAETVTKSRHPVVADQDHLMPPVHARFQKKCAVSNDNTTNQVPGSESAQDVVTRQARRRNDLMSSATEPGQNKSDETSQQNSKDESDERFDQTVRGSKEPRSSQTTQEDYYEPTQPRQSGVKSQASNRDEPEFISERTLKRKRRGVQETPHFTVFKDDEHSSNSATAAHIKEEPQESQPVPVSQILASHLPTGHALDLDEMTNQLETPRKRRQLRTSSKYPRIKRNDLRGVPVLLQERSFSAPADLNRLLPHNLRNGRERSTAHAEEVDDSDILHVTSGDEANIGEVTDPLSSPRDYRIAKPLRQVDANTRVPLPQPQFRPQAVKKSGRQSRGAKAINLVSESGEEGAFESEMSAQMIEESRRRLTGLLEIDRSPEKRMIAKPLNLTPCRVELSVHKSGSSRKTPQSEPMPRKRLSLNSTPRTASKMPQRSSKRLLERSHQPLRSKPLEQLSINDFKINPDVNEGMASAYNQVVRNREARRCLPGCIREECCGSTFRALVESGVDPPPIKEDLWGESQTDLTNDDKFLRAYLGSTYNKEAFALKSSAEQQELLKTAKMKAWANHSGRHRKTYQRERTPPGFWRTDFPGTQEAESDREAARKEERRLVEERWREAMTEGGRWLFRDE